ncbi:phosphotriesterase family protein [Persicitalea jodogahamensis]|uniref:Aryldialkylphosphatase n=1 Tax=Persicitalea jodogahamensis TaxID=402147 RepID=A0A8J3D6S8_9BACT|nr:phosphotriesterase [Persicitalea jodogahamensis]GHB82425.1 aryldialkylphosphatase [Persicitalea jodogahamensis]
MPLLLGRASASSEVMSVRGQMMASEMGMTLAHEHVMVDFVGADKISDERWARKEIIKKVVPYLILARQRGVKTLLDCTPAFLGRDVKLLREISLESKLNIITNTGYYGAVDNKYLPPWAFTETETQLAARWIYEFNEGIEGTGIKPGFIKIGVNSGSLSKLHQKLVRAAALTHLATGLTICSHTGPALPAFEEIELLKEMGVHPSAFVWVHAQAETDRSYYLKAARQGGWVSLDGMGWGKFEEYAESLVLLKKHELLSKVLVSHDAGWYRPGEPDPMGSFAGYTNIFDRVWPLLKRKGFTDSDFQQLLVQNPASAFSISIRKF